VRGKQTTAAKIDVSPIAKLPLASHLGGAVFKRLSFFNAMYAFDYYI
jgi:hypothetical protein